MSSSQRDQGKPRIPFVTQCSEDVQQALDKAPQHNGLPANAWRELAHHPRILKRFLLLGAAFTNQGTLPIRVREIIVLRLSWRTGCEYEFGNHILVASKSGFSDEEIWSLTTPDPDAEWSDDERLLITLVDELYKDDSISEATWVRLQGRWAPQSIIEMVTLAGLYRMLAGFVKSFEVPREDAVPGWPRGER